MKPDCRNFRERLADALRGPLPAVHQPAPPFLGGLAWHRHVIDCAACRELLDEEEALDELLRSLPQPYLPRALAERVLSRLEGARRGVDLDRLLDLPAAEPVPADLARHVLARVHSEQRLDRLLEHVPAERIPAGFERRILARLELARRGKTVRQTARAARPVFMGAALAHSNTKRSRSLTLPLRIAAGVALASLAGWGAWSLRRSLIDHPTPPRPVISEDTTPAAPNSFRPQLLPIPESPANGELASNGIAQPDDQLLASLEMFEAWDLLASAEGGVDASLATLDSLDEYLLDFDSTAQPAESAPATESSGGAPESEPKNTKKNG